MPKAFRDFNWHLKQLQSGSYDAKAAQAEREAQIRRIEQAKRAQQSGQQNRQPGADQRTPLTKADAAAAARKAFDAWARGGQSGASGRPASSQPAPTEETKRTLAAQGKQLPVTPQEAGGLLRGFLNTGLVAERGADGRVVYRKAGEFERIEFPSAALNHLGHGARAGVAAEFKDLGSALLASAPAALGSGQMVSFEGYLARFGNEDYSGDICLPGCFTATIADAKQRQQETGAKYLWPLLADHDTSRPIGGILSAIEDKNGLLISAEIDPDTQDGHDAVSQISKKYGTGLSIGYYAVKSRYDVKGVRLLEIVDLFEGSVVVLAANPLAGVTSIGSTGSSSLN